MKIKIWLIVILAAAVRFYALGRVPSGLVNDEAAFGYNAYSLLKTGKDEFGEPWPIVFRSFGEGKLPGYVYLTMPSVAVFGLNELAVRLPSALLGVGTVLLVTLWSPLAGLVLATMPWHIHFSRAAFEANAALFFIVLGTWLWQKKRPRSSLAAFIVAVFTYNAARLFVPLWFAYLVWPKRQFKLLLGLLIVWAALFFIKPELGRFGGISLFNRQSGVEQRLEQKFAETANQPFILTRLLHNKPVEYSWDFARRYASHFNPDFLLFSGDPIRPRYRVPDTGQLLWLSLPFLIIGLYAAAKKKQWPMLVWLLLSPLPAAITFETPSAIRSLFMAVPLAWLTGAGINQAKKFWLPIAFVFVFNFAAYLDAYFVHAPVHQPYEWQGGYKELVSTVNRLMPGYDKALITDSRGTAYIYFLFYNAYNPAQWQEQSRLAVTQPDKFGFSSIDHLNNLYFIGERCPAKVPEDKVLYVCNIAIESDRPGGEFIQFEETINFDDGQPAFVLYERNHEKI